MPQQLGARQRREQEYGGDHPGGQRQTQHQEARNSAQPVGARGAGGKFQAGNVDAQLAKVAHHQAAAGVDGAFVKARGRHPVRHQQQRGEPAGRKAGLSAKDESYAAGCSGQAPVRAWISIAQGVSGGFSWNALIK